MNPYNHAILNIKINLDIKEIGNKKENILINNKTGGEPVHEDLQSFRILQVR
jgi:hypothetical protein